MDLVLGQLHDSPSLNQIRDRSFVFRPTKTKKGRRPIDLPPSAVQVPVDHPERQELGPLMPGKVSTAADLVFSHPDGTPLRPDSITAAWVMLAAGSELKPIRLHDARHSHASIMLQQGIHPKVVQEKAGPFHYCATTLGIYYHVAADLREAAAKRFDEAFTASYNELPEEIVG